MLVGADELEKDAVAADFAEMVEEDLRPFNVERTVRRRDEVVDALIDAASTLPMMAPRRVIVVAGAEKLLMPKRRARRRTRSRSGSKRSSRRLPRTPPSCSSAGRWTCAGG